MLFLGFIRRAGLLLASLPIGLLSTNCRPSYQAFVQYQRPEHSVETLPTGMPLSDQQAVAPPIKQSLPIDTLPVFIAEQQTKPVILPKAQHLSNPETPKSKSGLFRKLATSNDPTYAEYAPRREAPVLTTKRRVPNLVKASLAGGVVSQGLLLLGTASGTIWFLAVLLPIASVLMGVAGLAKITRQREEYRGKGWAMSAIMLATGALGLAIVAAAALATSEILWK